MLSLMLAACLTLADPVTVTVEKIAIDPAALKKIKPLAELHVKEKGRDVVYKGIPFRSLLASEHVIELEGMASLRLISDAVLIVRGSDGYQAAVSAAAVAMDETGARFFLAVECDGKPLVESQGPVKLVIPEDSKPVRWVHSIDAISLVRMPKITGSAKPDR